MIGEEFADRDEALDKSPIYPLTVLSHTPTYRPL